MGLIQEFKDFAMKGNVIDLAVGLIIGAEFGKIVNSVVNDVIMPPIGKYLGGVNFTDLKHSLGQTAVLDDKGVQVIKNGEPQFKEAFINYGSCIQQIVNFVIIAFCVFLLVKAMNAAKTMAAKKEAEAPAAPPEPAADVKLLTEIRDLLQKR